MSDITANVVVSMPSQLFTMARSFKAVANGKIYIGKIDTDPVNPENQIQVYVENEDGSHVPVSQPIIINAAGYPVYNGQIAKFVTVQGHSMAVYDAYGSLQFNFPNVLKYDPDQLRQEITSTGDGKGADMIPLTQGGTIQNAVFAVTPQAYGATCDGVADDSDAVEEMMAAYPNHLIITIPPGSVLTIKRKLVYGGRRFEVRGYSGDMTNKVIGAESSQLYCDVPGDYAIQCENSDVFLSDVIVKGIPQYGNGTIGTNKGISTLNGNIKTNRTSWLGFDVPCQGINSFYVTFIDTDWLANKNGPDIQQAYNIKFIGGRSVDFDTFFKMSAAAGNGPINFIAMAFERWTNYVVGTDSAALIRPQNIAFKFCYFENMDDQSIYNGLTGRAGAATPGDAFYKKYAYARILVGTPTSFSMDETNTVYAKGLENGCIAIDSWGIRDLVFKPKIVTPADSWNSNQRPLSMVRATYLDHVDVFNNNTSPDGDLGFPFISSDNSTLLPTIRSGVGVSHGKTVLFNGFYNQTITFQDVPAGVNVYQDITTTEKLDMVNASVKITSRSAASAIATTQLQVLSSNKIRVHITNGHSNPVTFSVAIVMPYLFK